MPPTLGGSLSPGRESDVVLIADTMMNEDVDAICMQVESQVQQNPVEWRFLALRQMLSGLVQHLRDRSTRLRILFRLVSTFTPQPLNLDQLEGNAWLRVGRELCDTVISAVDALHSPPPARGSGEDQACAFPPPVPGGPAGGPVSAAPGGHVSGAMGTP